MSSADEQLKVDLVRALEKAVAAGMGSFSAFAVVERFYEDLEKSQWGERFEELKGRTGSNVVELKRQ